MYRHPPHTPTLLAALLLPLFSGLALANEVELNTITIEASTPTQDNTVSAADIAQSQARDLNDLYRRDAEIAVGGGANPIAQKVYIRGMEESLLSMTVDGAYNSGKVYHHQSALIIDPQLIKRIEVEKGTAAASAGPGALGGAIRISTLDGRDLLADGRRFGAKLSAGLASNRGVRGLASSYGKLGEQADFLLSASRLNTRNYRDGAGNTVAHSDTEQQHLLAKLGLDLGSSQRLSLGYQASEDEGVRDARANMVAFPHPVLPNDPIPQNLQRRTSTLAYTAQPGHGVDRLAVNAYHNQVETERTNLAGRNWGEALRSQGVDLALQSALGAHLLKYGLNWREEDSAARAIRNPYNLTGSGREDASVGGAYIEGLLDFNPLELSLGLRHDRYRYQDNHGQTFRSSGASPSAGLAWQANAALRLKLGYAKALRGVGMKEAFMLDIARWKNVAAIEAEQASNREIGFEYREGGFSLNGNAYRQLIANYITTVACTSSAGGCRQNAGAARISGYELGSAYTQGGFSAGFSVAHSKPRFNGQPFSDAELGLGTSSGRSWVLRSAYRGWDDKLELGWHARLVEGFDYRPVGSTSQRRKAGYGVHDVYANWQPRGKQGPSLNLAVKNLFDKFYYDQATYGWNGYQNKQLGYAEAGRDVRLEAAWAF